MSAKNLDQKGRLRSKIISFRMSPEENKLLDRKVLLSGYTKQDYIISCILKKEIVVYANPYVFRSLHDELIHFINLYGMAISEDDEEMMIWVLQMILAIHAKEKSSVRPKPDIQAIFKK